MNWRLLHRLAWRYRAGLAFSTAIMLAETLVALGIPFLGGRVAQGLVEKTGAGATAAVGLLLLLLAAQAGLRFTARYVLGANAARILTDLRVRVYEHLQALPIGWHDEHRRGEMLALMTHEVGQLASFLTGTATSLAPLLLGVVGALALMFAIDPWLASAAAVLMPAFFLVMKFVGRKLRPLAIQLRQAYGRSIGLVEENLASLMVVKAFGLEARESERHRQSAMDIERLSVQQLRAEAALAPVTQWLAATAVVLMLWAASQRPGVESMGVAGLVSFLLYAALLARPLGALANVWGQVQMAKATLEKMGEVLAEPAEDVERGVQLPRVRGAIAFTDIHFAYPGRAPTLAGACLTLAPGTVTAIVGANGAGKSTMAKLLLRLHDPQQGTIEIDGMDLQSVSLKSLRQQIGIVPQQVQLFDGSIRANILVGDPGASEARMRYAAAISQVDAFVSELPQGYDTLVGDQGVRLSGGQRQRLALARALLKDPPILILDEATAMFDPQAERDFLVECRKALAGRTVIIITHRPASLAFADRVVRLESGRIREAERIDTREGEAIAA